MIQLPLEVYRIDMKYIRNLHNIDDRVLSVSPQIGKEERPFLGVLVVCNEHKYCVPLSKPKKKHEKMRDKIDFKRIVHQGKLIGVLNFNLMIPVEDSIIQKIDTKIRRHDNADTRKKKELLIKELRWCNEHSRDIINTANVLYKKYVSGEHFSARKQCLDFERMETECQKFINKTVCFKTENRLFHQISKERNINMNQSRPEYDMKKMGRKMKYYRTRRNLTVEEVRLYMQFASVQAIYKWESGMCFPTADNLMALSELYQVNPMELMPKRTEGGIGKVFEGVKILIECNNRKNKVDYILCA